MAGRKRHTRSLRTAKRFEIVGNLLPSPHVLILHSEVHELENEATFLHACEIKFRGGLGMRLKSSFISQSKVAPHLTYTHDKWIAYKVRYS